MQKMPNLVDETGLNRILMQVYRHVKNLGYDNGFTNNSYNFGVNIPNIIPLNKIFEKKINRYLKTHPDDGLQSFVDDIDDGDYIEQVLHDLGCIFVEYGVPERMDTDERFVGLIQERLSRKIEPTEDAMTYKEMGSGDVKVSAADYFKLMYGMLLDTIRQSQQRQTRKKRGSKRSKKGKSKKNKTCSSPKTCSSQKI